MKISKEATEAAVKFGSEALVLCDWIDTTNLVFIGGRGVAKSTVILARRSERCVRLMPGAPVAIVANTYSNLIDNIMPAVQNGWKLNGLIEGVHYIKGKRPRWNGRKDVPLLSMITGTFIVSGMALLYFSALSIIPRCSPVNPSPTSCSMKRNTLPIAAPPVSCLFSEATRLLTDAATFTEV